jgi:hypothetical protein
MVHGTKILLVAIETMPLFITYTKARIPFLGQTMVEDPRNVSLGAKAPTNVTPSYEALTTTSSSVGYAKGRALTSMV